MLNVKAIWFLKSRVLFVLLLLFFALSLKKVQSDRYGPIILDYRIVTGIFTLPPPMYLCNAMLEQILETLCDVFKEEIEKAWERWE